MNTDKSLLPDVITTRKRHSYLLDLLGYLRKWPRNNLEVLGQDNSDTDASLPNIQKKLVTSNGDLCQGSPTLTQLALTYSCAHEVMRVSLRTPPGFREREGKWGVRSSSSSRRR
jgi:hypothetical protein